MLDLFLASECGKYQQSNKAMLLERSRYQSSVQSISTTSPLCAVHAPIGHFPEDQHCGTICQQGKSSDCTHDTSPWALHFRPQPDAQLMSSQDSGQHACGTGQKVGQNVEQDGRLGNTVLTILSCETILVCHLRRGMRRAASRAARSRRAASPSACWTATASARCPPRPCPQSAPPEIRYRRTCPDHGLANQACFLEDLDDFHIISLVSPSCDPALQSCSVCQTTSCLQPVSRPALGDSVRKAIVP